MNDKHSPGVQRYIDDAAAQVERRTELRNKIRKLRFDTIAVHGMYDLEASMSGAQGAIVEPIFPSTSQAYRDSDEMEAALSYQIPTWCYSRIHNPTVGYLEDTLALLESYGTNILASALCTSSGMSAIKQAIEPLVAQKPGDSSPINFVSAAQVYGGTFQLFDVRMRERGAEVRWVRDGWNNDSWLPLIDENTRFIYAEMPSNPQQACFDLEHLAAIAHSHGIPLIVDATIATPVLMRPLAHGADIVIHSLSKTVGSSGTAIAGCIIARHELVAHHLAPEARSNYAGWLKLWPFRDSGPCMSPGTAHALLSELKTLRWKVMHLSANAQKVAEFLSGHKMVDKVDYLGLPHHPLHELAKKYMRIVDDGAPAFGHLLSFTIRGTAADARTFFDGLERTFRATDLGRIKSVATIPAISTHQQQGEEARKLAGVPATMVRLCVGGEHPDDTIADLDQALSKIKHHRRTHENSVHRLRDSRTRTV